MNSSSPAHLTSFENVKERVFGPDLARALAIFFVMISHMGGLYASWLGRIFPFGLAILGFFGVTLFFTLSGFLIGTILLTMTEQKVGAQEWGIFFIRRWLRTLPAYMSWLAILVLLSWAGNFIVPWPIIQQVIPYYLTLTQNLAWPMVSFWYGVSWSLTVEEWFYIGFPALIILLLAFRLKRPLVLGLATFCLVLFPLLVRLHLPIDINWDEVTSKMVISRVDSLAYGVIAAMAWRYMRLAQTHAFLLFCCGVFIVFYIWASGSYSALHFWTTHTQNMFIFNVTGIGYGLCMPFLMSWRSVPSWVRTPITLTSNHSYSLYLVHLSLMLVATTLKDRYGLSPYTTILFTCISIPLASFFIWRYIEKPCLKIRPHQHLK